MMLYGGHSYGGCVISGVADRVSDRIAALVYLDAFILEDGQGLFETIPTEVRKGQLELTRNSGRRLEGAATSSRVLQR